MIHSFHNSSFRDQETGLYNEAYFMEVFYREWHRMLREHHALSVLVIHPQVDISNPRGFDEYKKLADVISRSTFRATDLVSRFNEREFIVGLFDLAPNDATVVINRILADISQTDDLVLHAKSTFIGGLHVYPKQDLDISEVIKSVISIKKGNGKSEEACNQFELQQLH